MGSECEALVEAVRGEAPPFRLRAATTEDVDFLWRLTATTMREYVAALGRWDGALQETRFRHAFAPARWRVVVVGDRDAGGFAVERHAKALFLADLYLLPEYQRRGIGSAVLRVLASEARGLGLPLVLQVLDSNPAARRLYERLGFALVGPSPVPHYSIMATPS